nr:13E12 repeat family protein [Nocardioides sp. B-3]
MGAAVLDGRVNLDRAVVIARALDDLPEEVPTEVREQAELHLISLADDFAPTELQRPASKVLEVVAPELSEEAERKALEREEQRATEHTRLTVTPRGDGTNRIGGIISNATTARLMTYLEAFASPRRTASENDGERIPTARLLGLALGDLLEALPADVLPAHGGTATTVTVHLNLDQLTASLEKSGVATLDTGDTITAGQARRLACRAKILPAVLSGKSEILDLGRSRRLHTAAQRKAIRIQHHQCQTDGCTIPAAPVRNPPPPRPVRRRQNRPRQRRPPLLPPPPQSPRHPLPHPTTPQRRLPLHRAHVDQREACTFMMRTQLLDVGAQGCWPDSTTTRGSLLVVHQSR